MATKRSVTTRQKQQTTSGTKTDIPPKGKETDRTIMFTSDEIHSIIIEPAKSAMEIASRGVSHPRPPPPPPFVIKIVLKPLPKTKPMK
jgi:hypothetical protein